MSYRNFFFLSYWFSQPYGLDGTTWWICFTIFGALVVIGLAALIYRFKTPDKNWRVASNRLAAASLTMGLLGLLWFFFRQYHAYFLGWRFWMLAWFIVSLGWFYVIIMYIIKRLPVIKTLNKERQEREKYLPKS